MRVAPSPSIKSTLRKQLRGERSRLSAPVHASLSRLAAKALLRRSAFTAGRRIALYLPFDGEADTAALIRAGRRRGVRIFVPVICDRRHRLMRFHPLKGSTKPGVHGISVPRATGRPVAPRWLNLIIVPLVGVDAHGRRLGLGGGYYDRALAFRRGRRCWRGPKVVGFAFDCQRTNVEFAEPWDLAMDSVATESGVHLFS